MVLYFSATGNTRFVATELAKHLEDEALDLCSKVKQHDYETIRSDKPFVFCAPTYVCAAPAFFYDFLRKVDLAGSPDVYMISTSGGYSGISSDIARAIIRKKHMNYKGCAEFKMPPNYIANKSHKLPGKEEIEKRISDTCQKIEPVADIIRSGKPLRHRHIWLLEKLIDYPSNPVLSLIGHRVKGFYATDGCIACGLCEKKCPLNIISMRDGRPRWKGRTCAHCMACIQNCPVEAIEYKEITNGRKRYRCDDYRKNTGRAIK